MPLVLLGLIYSQSSGSARAYFGLVLWRAAQPNLGLRPLSTPSCLLGPLRNPSGLQAPLRAYSGAVLVIFPIPSVFRPNSAHSVFVPGAIIIHRMRILYRCPAFTAQPASSFPLLHPPSSASAPISVLSCAVATGSSTVATGCSSEDSSCYPEDPGRSPEGSVASPKSSDQGPELTPSGRGLYAVTLSRQAYLHRHPVHYLLFSVYCPLSIVLGLLSSVPRPSIPRYPVSVPRFRPQRSPCARGCSLPRSCLL
jgi:hypothetical protein